MLDIDAAPSESEIQLILQKSRVRIAQWRLRTGIAGFALLFVYSVGLLAEGHVSTTTFNLVFRISVALLMILWLATISSGYVWYLAWTKDREFRKTHLDDSRK